MNAQVQKILEAFKSHSGEELSTGNLIQLVYPNEFKEGSFGEGRFLSHKKAVLHRKILYYLNSLVNSQILRVTGERRHGEKYFSLNLAQGEELILKNGTKRIHLPKRDKIELPIGDLESKKILLKLDGNKWLFQLNSIFINTESISSLKEFKSILNNYQNLVNDGIGFPEFNKILIKMNKDEIKKLIDFLKDISNDYNKYFTFNINLINSDSIRFFCESIIDLNDRRLNIVLSLDSKELESEIFISILNKTISSKKIIQIKNNSIHKAPYLFGKAGPYTFNEEEWGITKKGQILACSQMSFGIDINRTFKEIKDFKRVREIFHRIARAIFFANSHQRASMNGYFHPKLNFEDSKDFFILSKNYIRLWNYGLKESKELEDLFIPLIKSIKEELNNFCSQEETIYKSCGMPTRFKIAFSYLSREFAENRFSSSNFSRIEIKNIKDIFEDNFSDYMKIREDISKMLDGGDRTRFYRIGQTNLKSILKEINTILNLYKIPVFCYDFSHLSNPEVKLTKFF